MSNSPLTDVTILSPNYSTRADKIRKITIHHMAGVMSADGCGNWFRTGTRAASSNYGIGWDGKIGLYVPEDKRAWTSSSRANDNQAVTIELSNSYAGGSWPVSDKVIARCIDLCADICRRNGLAKLVYTGDTSGNLTRHDMFASTNCPGPYLAGKLPYIVAEVNKRLTGEEGTAAEISVVNDAEIEAGVLAFQKWLNSRFIAELSEDGDYGPRTRQEAIRAFQKVLNSVFGTRLVTDGLWGAKTSSATQEHVELAKGDTGDLVTILQGMLYCHRLDPKGLDGDFGGGTEGAVEAYQMSESLEPDGVAGKMTFSRLFSS